MQELQVNTAHNELSTASEAQIRRTVIRLAMPAVFEMTLNTFIWMVDTAIVGRLSTEALAAVSFASNILYTLIFIYGALGVGTTALIARYAGSGDTAALHRASAQALVMSLVLGACAFVSVRAFAPMVFGLANLAPDVRTLALHFIDVVSYGAPLAIVSSACTGVLRGTGDTRTPLYATLTMNMVSAFTEYVLIYGVAFFPKLGFTGAAIGPIAGWVAGTSVALFALLNRGPELRAALRSNFGWSREQAGRLLRLSLPAAAENLLMDGARTAGMVLVGGLGTVAVATHQVTACAESFSFMPGYGFAISSSIITGQALGAGSPLYARRATREALRIAAAFMGAMGLFFILAPNLLISIFTEDPRVITLGASCLRIVGFGQVFVAATEVISGALRGAGDTRSSMIITAIGMWLFRIPLTYLVTRRFNLGLEAVWVIMPIDWAFRCLLAYLRFRGEKWQAVRI